VQDTRAQLTPAGGTKSSNPFRSTGESGANLTPASLRDSDTSPAGFTVDGGPRVRIPVPFKAIIGWSAL